MDTDLVVLAQHGDREAFGLLAADLATRFLAVSRRILLDLDLAEDATQQALVAIWRDLPQLRDPARFDAWSYRGKCAQWGSRPGTTSQPDARPE